MGHYAGKSCDEIVSLQLTHEPTLGEGDVSKCLPGWLESFARWFDEGGDKTLSHGVINAVFHTLIAAKIRTARLAAEVQRLKEELAKEQAK